MHGLFQDVRFALRTFVRTPRFTIPALLALALGIGSAAATFSVVRGVMLEPLPYRDPDRIVAVWENNARRNRPRNVIAPGNYVQWRDRNRSFSSLGVVGPARMSLMLGGQPEEVAGLTASSHVFTVLGVQPALGRAYTADEDIKGRDAVMVLTHEFWQSRLGGRADALGSTIVAGGEPRTIVGIMPPGFTVLGQKASFLVPYGWTEEALRTAPGRGNSHGLARLRDGVTLDQATADMTALARQLEQEFPQRNTGWSVTLVPVHEQMVDQIRPALLVLSGAVGLVLLIACVNVANLLLARGTVRARELGIRAALGAGRGRLVRQLLSESLVLGGAAAMLGIGLAWAFHRGLLALVADRIPVPRLDQVALNVPVLGFAVLLALVTALLFGVVPATVAARSVDVSIRASGRHGAGRRSRRLLNALVVAEVALSIVLLAGAGLLVRSLLRLQAVDTGMRVEKLMTARVQLPATGYDDDRAARFYSEAVARIGQVPGVQAAAAVSFLPLAGPGIGTSFHDASQPPPPPGEAPTTDVRPVTPGFFRAMGIPQRAGQDFSDADRAEGPRVAIVSESLARTHLPGRDPLGMRLHVNVGAPGGIDVVVVGVVGDIRMSSLDREPRPAVYLPHTQLSLGIMTFVLRTEGDPTALVRPLTAIVHEMDPQVPLADVQTMDDVVQATLARPRTVAVLLAVFAGLALVLAVVGVYGVIAYSVSQRTREIGVRMALGATSRSVFRLVVGEALTLALAGVATGMAVAAALTRVLASLLFETRPVDPATFAAAGLVLTVAAVLASLVPARRGTRVNAVEALRAE